MLVQVSVGIEHINDIVTAGFERALDTLDVNHTNTFWERAWRNMPCVADDTIDMLMDVVCNNSDGDQFNERVCSCPQG